MTETANLKPCPFCGGGQFRIHENGRTWRGTSGWSEPISIEVQHWCDPIPGQPAPRMMAFVGRDQAAAVAAWNRRAGR